MGNSRQKGARGERELAQYLTTLGFPARRTQQYCGHAGDSDVRIDGLDLFIECKRYKESIKIHTDQFADWIKLCWRQSHGKPWFLFTRNDREPWYMTYVPHGVAYPHTVTGDEVIKQILTASTYMITRGIYT